MKHRLLSILLLTALLPAAPALAKLYKWVDANGKIHYSDKVPPEAATQGREEKSDSGVTVNKVAAPKTKAELEAEERAKAEEEAVKQAERDAKKKQDDQDRILLLTFSEVKEIERARDDRLAAADARIQLTQGRIDKLQAQLEQARTQAANAERAGRPTKDHHARIETLHTQIAENEEFVQARTREREAIESKFNADIVRFNELKEQQAAPPRR